MYLTNEHMGYLRTMTRILNLMAFAWLLGFHGRTAPLQWYLGLQHGFIMFPVNTALAKGIRIRSTATGD